MSYKADLKNILVNKIERNPENPRLFFRQEEMEQLYLSIKNKGLLVPISVYDDGGNYVIIDGERRWRTFIKLNYETIPAIIQDKPSPLDNLLLMFNIHGLREQWDIYTIAMKLERVVNLLIDLNGYYPTETQISEETGMSRGVIRRSKMIISLPERFKEMLKIELEKPKRNQEFSEDFFIEMENSLRAVNKYFPNLIIDINSVRDILIDKYRIKVINNVTDFRKLTKIATATKNLNISNAKVINALNIIFSNNDIGIESVFRDTVEPLYDGKIMISNANNFLQKIENLSFNDITNQVNLRMALIRIKNQIENLIRD